MRKYDTEQEALDDIDVIIEEEYCDFCVDNKRIGYIDDVESMIDYETIRRNGCCGFFDEDVIIDDRVAKFGCNYGH